MAGQVSARARAREATAELIRRRREREKQIQGAVARFFTAEEARESAVQALRDAEADRDAALAAVSSLGLTVSDVVELCGVEATDVRQARKRTPAGDDPVADPLPTEDDANSDGASE